MNKKQEKRALEALNKIKVLTRHIRNVSDNCMILGEKLIQQGDIELGQQLIANGFSHDLSKFKGIEWKELTANNAEDNESSKIRLRIAIEQHNSTNTHHPEFWGSIKAMPLIYLLELLCDWKARSEEFGTSLIDYINNKAMKRFKFEKSDEVYKALIKYHDILCEKPFEAV